MKRIAAFIALLCVPAAALADEGMWTLDNVPVERIEKAHGFAPSDGWLERARLSSVRLAGGCSGSFVSSNGLIMTNHHCAAPCIQQLSSAKKDLMKDGFMARTRADEAKCPAVEINQLVEIRDVTDRIHKATRGLEDEARNRARKAEMTRIEEECSARGRWRCDVVTLYHGGRYDLYRYRRYQDVRLVFAPEFQVAFFGGDPDNFTFPRYDFDVSFLRVYEAGKPAVTKHHFRFGEKGAAKGDLVFVTGHPGRTMRLHTVAQLEFLRDVLIPMRIALLAEIRGILTQFGRQDAESARIARGDLFYIENSFKAYKGMWEALADPALMGLKRADERRVRGRVESDPSLAGRFAGAWDEMAGAQKRFREILKRHYMLEGRGSGLSRLFSIARTLVRAEVELKKPDHERLREFTDAGLPTLEQRLFSPAPIYPALEEVETAFWLTKLREFLGPDDPAVRKILSNESPESLAKMLVGGSKLADVGLRRRLWKEGTAGSDDPMIRFARLFDGDARAVRKMYEDEVEAVETKSAESIAQARFAVDGMDTYPDATFTLRITWGTVAGYRENGEEVNPVTRLEGLFDRATGRYPYQLPGRWLDAKGRLDLATLANFASSCDIVGGNSGSPVVNRDLEVVGLIFDGNIQSLGGAFWFDARVNRAVAVETPFIIEALRKVYGADGLVGELTED